MSIKNYLSLVKFSHTVFALPFALIGLCWGLVQVRDRLPGIGWLGKITHFSAAGAGTKLLLVLACMVLARTAAMAFNRWLDADIDAKNPRTAMREIPAGKIARKQALGLVVFCCLLFVGCTWFINPLCFWLSPVALFVLLFYSFTKRFTAWCHLVLGLGLGLAPLGAYLAATGSFALEPVLISLAVLSWVAGFDIIYALQDTDFDKKESLHSIPVKLGPANALRVSEGLHLLSMVALTFAGILGDRGGWYMAGLLVFGLLLIYQHRLVKPGDLSRVNMAFFTTNGVASVVFALFVLTDLLTHK
jgi:4-hydroxybenzoate polyprenyltransferase